MSNMVYANPFGAALSGKEAAINDTMKIGQEARQQRGEDLGYDFQKWYQPLQQAAAQNQVGSALYKTAMEHAYYTGNSGAPNSVLQNFFGIDPSTLPPGYANGPMGPQQQLAGSYSSGVIDPNFSVPGTFIAGNTRRALPGEPQQAPDPMQQQLYTLTMQHLIRQAQEAANGGQSAASGGVDFMNPTATRAPAMGAAPPVPKDPYNMGGSLNVNSMNPTGHTAPAPTAQPSQNPKSIWADEQQGASNGY